MKSERKKRKVNEVWNKIISDDIESWKSERGKILNFKSGQTLGN
jgi:hypothetical protein